MSFGFHLFATNPPVSWSMLILLSVLGSGVGAGVTLASTGGVASKKDLKFFEASTANVFSNRGDRMS